MDKIKLTYKGKHIGWGSFPGEYAKNMQMQSTTKDRVSETEDCTDAFRIIYKKHYLPAMNSKSQVIRDKGVMEFIQICEGIAGVKLPQDNIKNIIRQCKDPKRMKLNKFGRFFGRRNNKEVDIFGEMVRK
jgi:hypothetical protein